MNTEITNKLMKVGLTDEQFDIVSEYIDELLLENKPQEENKFSVFNTDEYSRFIKLLRMNRKEPDRFQVYFGSDLGQGKSHIAMKMYDDYIKQVRTNLGLDVDYNEFIRRNRNVKVVQDFVKFVKRNQK